ncbi:MAG: septum formation initiator family protein [Paracoccaceae bacterium]
METTAHKSRFGDVILAFLVVVAMGYFAFTAIQGENGLLKLFQVQDQRDFLEAELSSLQAEREIAENLAKRLSDQYLDLDLLDEQARRVLGMARGDEVIFN